MESPLFQNQEYKEITQNYIIDTIAILFNDNREFSIVCDTEFIEYEPPLPQDILAQFGKNVLFSLAGYTFESAKIEDDFFIFEAGFGTENLGAVVAMPILAIKQVVVDETPLLINICTPTVTPQEHNTKGVETSMSMLLNNPENQALLNKMKKK